MLTFSDLNGKLSNELKQAIVPLVGKESCESSLSPKDGNIYELHDSTICAGGLKDEDTCEGDGGGPLVCKRANSANEVYVQVSISIIKSVLL